MNTSLSDSEMSESLDGNESERSSVYSNSTSSISTYTSTQFDCDEDKLVQSAENDIELVQISNTTIRLPRDLCSNKDIFEELFSVETWNIIPNEIQQSLIPLLPKLENMFESPEDVKKEHQITINLLFQNKLDCFGLTPLQKIQQELEAGNYRPDVVQLRHSIEKSIRREQRFQTCERLSYLARELFIKRERLLRNVYKSAAPEGVEPLIIPHQQAISNICMDERIYVVRARQRYAQEINKLFDLIGLKPTDLKEHDNHFELESDENMYFGQSFSRPKMNFSNPGTTEKCIYGTLFKRKHGLSDEEAQLQQQYSKQPRLNNKNFRKYLQTYKRRKLTKPNLPEFDNSDIRLRDVCTRAQMGGNFKRLIASGRSTAYKSKKYKFNKKPEKDIEIVSEDQHTQQFYDENRNKSKISDVVMSFEMLDDDIEINQEEIVSTSTATNTSSYEGIPEDHSNITIKQKNNIMLIPKLQPLQNMKSQHFPSSFFSLIRDFFCETSHHRLQLNELKEKLEHWISQPNSQIILKNWSSTINNWATQVSSAMDFLCGEFIPLPEEYVPYLEFKANCNIYQWIGAGRDSDVRLSSLSEYWLQWQKPITTITKFVQPNYCNKSIVKTKDTHQVLKNTGTGLNSNPMCANTIHITITTMASPTTSITTATTTTTTINSSNEPATVLACETPTSDNIPLPPPSRCPTNWIVRSAANEEIKDFQRQERERFENPHRAYTYRLHGYESIVGPVKGIYSEINAMTKARGHTMMIGDRPNFVTILTLVRDAVARLPNGEGTRADIAELVKSSQYLNHNAAENVLQTIVSGALDRMHTEIDPCVRYDSKRKIWIYLHRNRSEEEFERIHHEQQALLKIKKPNRKHKKLQSDLTPLSSDSITTTTATTTINHIPNLLSNPPPLTSVSGTCPPLPSLVPANTTMCYAQQQQQLKQNKILLKCPPVPPLKYHVPPPTTVQHQKSLLKSRIDDTIQLPQQQQRILVRSISTSNTSDKTSDDRKLVVKQQQAKITQQLTVSRSLATKLTSKTPILLSTSNGLQAVHVPNVNNVVGGSNHGIILTPSSTLNSPGMNNNKKLTLNKPLIINQITTATKSTQQQQHPKQNKINPLMKQQPTTQQQTQSFIIPFNNDALVPNASKKSPQSSSAETMFVDNTGKIQPVQQLHQEPHRPGPQGNNLIRLISASAATTAQVQSQTPQNKLSRPQVKVLAQQKSSTAIITTAATAKPTTTTSSNMSGLSLITPNRNASGGTIVKMTPQAFAVLQQQHSKQQQQHIILKPTKMLGSVSNLHINQQQQHRLIVSNPGNNSNNQQQSQHNILQSLSPNTVHNSAPTITSTALTPITMFPTPMTSNANNISMVKKGVQTITASNLSLQQQRTLLQGLKQQKHKQQNQQLNKTTTVNNFIQSFAQSNIQQVTRTINVTSTTTIPTTTVQSRVITSNAGQIISIEDLLQKQRSKQNSSTIPQIVTLTSCGTQQQTSAPQYGIVVSPTTRGIISINPTSSVISTGQSAPVSSTTVNTQSPPTSTALSISTNKSIIPSITPTTKTILSGSRVLMTTSTAGSIGGNIRIINANNATSTTTLNSLNFANLQGKQVVFSTKNQPQLQNQSVVIGGPAVKVQGNVTTGNQLQTVIVGNQILRLQQITSQSQNIKGIGGNVNRLTFPLAKKGPQVTNSSQSNLNVPLETVNNESTSSASQRFILGSNGKTIQIQTGAKINAVEDFMQNNHQQQISPTSTVTNTNSMGNNMLQGANRVVLAVQSGAPFILPAGSFQGGTINIKSLQNMKLVSLAPSAVAAAKKEQEVAQSKAPL